MKSLLLIALLSISVSVMARNVGANPGHHSGGNMGALGAAPGAFGGSSTSQGVSGGSPAAVGTTAAAEGQSGNGGRVYPEDEYQPWPESEMVQFQKP
jgi:hypothetical protein